MTARTTAAAALAGLLILAAGAGRAADDGWEYDRYNAEDINMVCAGCHGEYGQGGGGGVYPRLGGLPADYIADQLRAFKSRDRINIPMQPFTNERELPETDILDIAHYLSRIELRRHLPETDGTIDALTRLRQAEKVVQIPRHPGDVDNGERLYRGDCRLCHGNDGFGRGDNPPVAQQHVPYLRKQMEDMAEGTRWHEDADYFFADMRPADMDDLLAYLTTLDD